LPSRSLPTWQGVQDLLAEQVIACLASRSVLTPWGVEGSLRMHLRLSLSCPAFAEPKAPERCGGALQQFQLALARHSGEHWANALSGHLKGGKDHFLHLEVPKSRCSASKQHHIGCIAGFASRATGPFGGEVARGHMTVELKPASRVT
jgi:hypothetical protein